MRDKILEMLRAQHDLVLPIEGGGFIATDGEVHQYGAQVTVYDGEGHEVATWEKTEWLEAPESVMGAILGAAASTIGLKPNTGFKPGTCPTCMEHVTIKDQLTDASMVASCGHSFTPRAWYAQQEIQ